jgi:hypothetical protein
MTADMLALTGRQTMENVIGFGMARMLFYE